MPHHEWLDVRQRERFSQQWVVTEVELPHRQVVGGSPVSVDLVEQIKGQRAGSHDRVTATGCVQGAVVCHPSTGLGDVVTASSVAPAMESVADVFAVTGSSVVREGLAPPSPSHLDNASWRMWRGAQVSGFFITMDSCMAADIRATRTGRCSGT
jgi:hypothetical protein